MSCSAPSLKERLVELANPEATVPSDLRTHVDSCEECASELFAIQESWRLLEGDPAPPSEAVLARARAVAELPRRRHLLATAGVVGALLAVGAVLYLGTSGAHLNPMAFAAAAVLLAAYGVGLQAATGKRRGLFLALAVPGLALAVFSQPGAFDNSIVCIPLVGLVIAGPFLTTGWALLERGVDPLGGAFWGASMGVVGVGLFRLHCPHTGYLHALFIHTTLVPIFAGIGAALARALHSKMPRNTRLATEK